MVRRMAISATGTPMAACEYCTEQTGQLEDFPFCAACLRRMAADPVFANLAIEALSKPDRRAMERVRLRMSPAASPALTPPSSRRVSFGF